jgi:phytanoyl-CoA hydroxylase
MTPIVAKLTKHSASFHTHPEIALNAYLQQGFHIEPDVFTPEECNALIQAATNLPSYKDGTLVPVMHPHRIEPAFLVALRHPFLVQVMEHLVSGRASGLQSQFFFCRPGTPGFTRHQDNFYVQAKPDAFASAWIALDDVSSENGGLVVYPGSHLEPILPVEPVEQPGNFGQDPNANYQQAILPDGYPPTDVTVTQGSVVFLHAHIVHKSHNNRSRDRFRHALLLTYIRQGESFRPGFASKRAEVDIY